jgi:hypothetical protein
MDLSFTIAAGLASVVILGSESRRTQNHILLSQIWDSPILEGQVSIFISPRNREVQLYPQALGSLFIAFYDSQGYGGGIRTLLHTGLHLPTYLCALGFEVLSPVVIKCYVVRNVAPL